MPTERGGTVTRVRGVCAVECRQTADGQRRVEAGTSDPIDEPMDCRIASFGESVTPEITDVLAHEMVDRASEDPVEVRRRVGTDIMRGARVREPDVSGYFGMDRHGVHVQGLHVTPGNAGCNVNCVVVGTRGRGRTVIDCYRPEEESRVFSIYGLRGGR
jgi:hypothetical protein